MRAFPALAPLLLLAPSSFAEADPIDFKRQVLPIFEKHCFQCHSVEEGKEKGGVALDYPDEVARHIGDQEIIVPGSTAESDLLRLVLLDEDHKESMPPPGKGDALDAKEIAIIRDWIEQGASLEKGGAPTVDAKPVARVYEAWTNQIGKPIQAEFRTVEKGQVSLLLENGKVVKVPFNNLSPESQTLAKKRYAESKENSTSLKPQSK